MTDPRRGASSAQRAARLIGRHPVAFATTIGAIVRFALVLIIHHRYDRALSPDERGYIGLAIDVRSHRQPTWSDYQHILYSQRRAFIDSASFVMRVFGNTLGGQVTAVLWALACIALTTWLACRLFGNRVALITGVLLALWPSHVFWSSLALRDSALWACFALAAVGVDLLRDARWHSYLAGLVVVGVSLVLLDNLRDQSFAIVVVAASAALLLIRKLHWKQAIGTAAAVAAIGLAVPISLSHGAFARADFAGARTLGFERYINSLDGSPLALITSGQVFRLVTIRPGSSIAALSQTRALLHAVATPATTVPTPTTTPTTTTTSTPVTTTTTPVTTTTIPPTTTLPYDNSLKSSVRYLPNGLGKLMLRPFPWERSNGTASTLARLQAVPGYALLCLALAGVVLGRRQWRGLTFPIGLSASIIVAYALTEGNLGTAFRHREEATWCLTLLAAVTLDSLYRSVFRTRRPATPEPRGRSTPMIRRPVGVTPGEPDKVPVPPRPSQPPTSRSRPSASPGPDNIRRRPPN